MPSTTSLAASIPTGGGGASAGRCSAGTNGALETARSAEPEFAGRGAVLGAWASEFEPGAQALYESEGYEVMRYAFTMTHRHVQDAEPIPMPEGHRDCGR